MSQNEFEISFVIPALDGAFDPRIEAVEEQMDVVVSSHGGLTVATALCADADAMSAGLRVAEILETCGLRPLRTHPDLVTRQDIADRAEVTRQAVGNWARGERVHADPFPLPVHLVSGGVWLWGEVVAWLRRNGKSSDVMGYPSLDEHARIDAHLADAHRSDAHRLAGPTERVLAG